jgi:hypothetical protein
VELQAGVDDLERRRWVTSLAIVTSRVASMPASKSRSAW